MAQYRKKPVVIEAVQYQGDTTELPYDMGTSITRSTKGGSCFIDTLEGTHECRVGDWTKQTPEWQEAAAKWRDSLHSEPTTGVNR